MARQKELNAALDLDKNSQQVAEGAKIEERALVPQGFVGMERDRRHAATQR